MEIVNTIVNFASLVGVVFLVWDKLRASRLTCTLDGKKIAVPSDEVKECYRRSALAEASRIAGGRRVSFTKSEWRGRTLVLETEKEKI